MRNHIRFPGFYSCPDSDDNTICLLLQVEETLIILKLLERPDPPAASVLGPREVHVSWSKVETKSGLPVTYRLLDGKLDLNIVEHLL